MKKIFICLAILLSLTGCRTFNVNQAIKAPVRNYEQKLPTLEPVFENETQVKYWKAGDKVGKGNSHWATLFYREVEQNLINPQGKKKGYIVLRPIDHYSHHTGVGWSILSSCSLFTLNLLGMPFLSIESFHELEIEILNNKGELIKKYHAEYADEEYQALWWGWGSKTSTRKAAIYTSYKEALENLIEQIMHDQVYLTEKLK